MRVLVFDPGHTTGWCVIDSEPLTLVDAGECEDWRGMKTLFLTFKPEEVVYEIFRLYAWKSQVKSWDTFLEIEAIGVLKFLCLELHIPCIGQNPAERKFFTDEKLKEMNMVPASKHAKDAVRHGLLYIRYKRGLAKNK